VFRRASTSSLSNNQVKYNSASPDFYFSGGNVSVPSIFDLAKGIPTYSASSTPTAGGTLTVNSKNVGSYDFVSKQGNQTVSSFVASDWFTTTEDSRSAFIGVNGNLTINSGQTFIPSVRKLFTCIYVTGDLTVNGTISMTARGANHSGTGNSGGYTAPVDIRLASGTYSNVTNPFIPKAGGAGGTVSYSSNQPGVAGTNGGTGGGGMGTNDNTTWGGFGAPGTCFTGGSAGGGARTFSSITWIAGGSAGFNGGAGGAAYTGNGSGSWTPYATNPSSGGSGNPGGAGGENAGNNGTGGVLIIFVRGALLGSGSVQANGSAGTFASERPGGGSGGGSVTIFYGTDSSTFTTTAAGGVHSSIYGSQGDGGAGTARKLAF